MLGYGDDYEDHHDAHVSQMLVPRTHQEDATIILNNLLKEYDKTLRPDIGGEPLLLRVNFLPFHKTQKEESFGHHTLLSSSVAKHSARAASAVPLLGNESHEKKCDSVLSTT